MPCPISLKPAISPPKPKLISSPLATSKASSKIEPITMPSPSVANPACKPIALAKSPAATSAIFALTTRSTTSTTTAPLTLPS